MSNSVDLLQELEVKSPDMDKVKKLVERLELEHQEEQENSEIAKQLAHCYLILGNNKKAHEFYQNALFLKAVDDPELWFGIGLMYFRSNNFLYAEPSFLKVLSLAPDFPKKDSVNFKLGLIYKRLGNYTLAIQFFDHCLTGDDRVAALCQLGFCHSYAGESEPAAALFQNAFVSGKSPFTALCLAWDVRTRDFATALQVLNEGLSLCLKDTVEELDLLYAMARVLYEKKDCNEASNCYYKLLNKNSSDPNLWNSFGVMCAEIGQSVQAFQCFLKASEQAPNSAAVWNNIGALYWRSGQANESKIAYEKASRLAQKEGVVKEETKEFSYMDWDISELPYIKRNAVTKMKIENKEQEAIKRGGFVQNGVMTQNLMNSYAAMIGYLNFARQVSAIRQMKERTGTEVPVETVETKEEEVKNEIGNDDVTQAAEILSDLAHIMPNKRNRED
jgi:tetratricopeptide (TPR) repeat protein